jgi:hypothetical protein
MGMEDTQHIQTKTGGFVLTVQVIFWGEQIAVMPEGFLPGVGKSQDINYLLLFVVCPS